MRRFRRLVTVAALLASAAAHAARVELVPMVPGPPEAKGAAAKDARAVSSDAPAPGGDGSAQSFVPEVEPNGTPATATALGGTDVVARGDLFPNGDVDHWSFAGGAGDRVYVALQTSWSASANTDSQLTLLGTDGVTVVEFDDDDGSAGALSSTVAGATLPASGTYTLKVNHFSTTGQLRPYFLHLRVRSGSPTAEVEPNDTSATAQALPPSGWVRGTRSPASASEQDWFSFQAGPGDTVFLSLDLDPERDGVQWNGRLGLGLFGDAGNQVLTVDDATAGSASNPLSEALFVTVKSAGTYYAYVDAASSSVGGPTATYHLSVAVRPATPIGAACQTYSSGTVNLPIGPAAGSVTDSTIVVPGNPRIEDVNLSIALDHALMQDIDAALVSPAGNENSIFTDVGSGAAGGQTQMDLDLDDDAGIPPLYATLKGVGYQPELLYRLSWLRGEDAGGAWTLRLRDDNNSGSGGTLRSWSLTICEPPPPPACPGTMVAVFSADFESGDAGFTHSGTLDEWARGLPSSPPVTGCASGTACFKTDPAGTYEPSSTQELLSPVVSLAGVTAPLRARWAHRYQMDAASNDGYSVEAREPGPTDQRTLFQHLDASMTDTVGSPPAALQESAGWAVLDRSLDAYEGGSVQLRWLLTSNATTQLAGVAVDDVAVLGCCTPVSCDDGNPCTDDVCDPELGCIHPANAAACEDGNPCTGPDACSGGACAPGPNPCDDGDACTTDVCDGQGGCTHPPASCDDGNPCTDDGCAAATGCTHAANAAPCSDGDACTEGDRCEAALCLPGVPPAPVRLCNPGAVSILDSNAPPTAGSPYPSSITASGLGPRLCRAEVLLNGLGHAFPEDLDLLLAGPSGADAILLSDVGGDLPASGVNLVLSDGAASPLPDDGPLVSGTFRPTNAAGTGTESWPPPAPAPSGGSALSAFAGADPNGTWRLYAADDEAGDDGALASGFCLDLSASCGSAAACDDGDACTSDACDAGQGCLHTVTGSPPPEVTGVAFAADKQTLSWQPASGATRHDALRGDLSALPVGPGGGDETCFDDLPGASLSDPALPPPGAGFWYLARGENACATPGTWGARTGGASRATASCP
jgi:subtilisin-like proprotein convertase family protein